MIFMIFMTIMGLKNLKKWGKFFRKIVFCRHWMFEKKITAKLLAVKYTASKQ